MSTKVWNLMYRLGNTTRVMGDSGNPQTRKSALEGAAVVEKNGWPVWVEHYRTAKKIFESLPKGEDAQQPDTSEARQMTGAEFDVITVLISSRDPAKSAARRVLIDGLPPAQAAREFEIVPQSVSNTLRRIRKADATILSAYAIRRPAKKRARDD